MKNELTKWRFIFVVSYLNMLEKKEIPVVEVSGERKKERDRKIRVTQFLWHSTWTPERKTKRNARNGAVHNGLAASDKKENSKEKTSIVDVEKEK